jgi:hypothetical protein
MINSLSAEALIMNIPSGLPRFSLLGETGEMTDFKKKSIGLAGTSQ